MRAIVVACICAVLLTVGIVFVVVEARRPIYVSADPVDVIEPER